MNLTSIVWLLVFGGLAVAAMRRPIWGLALYWQTYYASPPFWWWRELPCSITDRWSLLAAGILAGSVLMHGNWKLGRREKWFLLLFLTYTVNATLVHVLFADNPERSYECLTYIWKYYALAAVVLAAIRNRDDLKLAIWFVILGTFYIGYEVVMNHRGTWSHSRLELHVIPQAGESNAMAGLLAVALPFGATFLLAGKRPWWQRAVLVVMLVFTFETVLRCNSRSVFLSMIAGGIIWLMMARGRARKRALIGACLVAMAIPLMVKSDKIVNRFNSIFVQESKRDGSAESRIFFWRAARQMMNDHPFGLGGECAFRSKIGNTYIADLPFGRDRAVHNGYLDIGTGWGVQGLTLYLAMILGIAWSLIWKTRKIPEEEVEWRLLGASLIAMLLIISVCATFASTLDNEWVIWWFLLSLAYVRLSEQMLVARDDVFIGNGMGIKDCG